MRLYCEEDLSLGEIAEQLRITRQGVSDALKKAKAQLEDYEAKLGLAARERRLRERSGRMPRGAGKYRSFARGRAAIGRGPARAQ